MPNNHQAKLVFSVALAVCSATSWAQSAPLPQGEVAAAKVEPTTPALKYRDPSVPLTIGEMSKLQAQKLESDFLKKLGFSSTPTATAAPSKTGEAAVKPRVAKPTAAMVVLGVYGTPKAMLADVSLQGSVLTVRDGTVLAGGITVVTVGPAGVQVSVPAKIKGGRPLIQTLAVGSMVEFLL